MSFIKELWDFMRVRKKFWLIPIMLMMVLFGALIVLSQGSAVAPFIYTLFQKVTVILGISAFYHDSAAALIINGEIIAAAQEERFTRKKHDSSYPVNAINYCLSEAALSLEQIDYIAKSYWIDRNEPIGPMKNQFQEY